MRVVATIVSIYVFAVAAMVAIFLSYADARGYDGPKQMVTPVHAGLGRIDNSPFSGARGFDVTLTKEDFATQREPIPYAHLDISRALNPWHYMMLMKVYTPPSELNTDWSQLLFPFGLALICIGFWVIYIGIQGYLALREIISKFLGNSDKE